MKLEIEKRVVLSEKEATAALVAWVSKLTGDTINDAKLVFRNGSEETFATNISVTWKG